MIKFAPKYQVAVIDESNKPYKLKFRSKRLSTPVLNTYIAQYEVINGKTFPSGDIERKRVGVILPLDLRLEGSCLPCTKISWAQAHVRSRVSDEMLPKSEHFSGLAVCCLLKTGNGHYILRKRSQEVSQYKGYWDVSASGWVDSKHAQENGGLLNQVFQELNEEVGIRDQIETIVQLGLCINPIPEHSFAEVCFLAETPLSTYKVVYLLRPTHSWEGKQYAFSKSELLMRLKKEPFKPAAAATIMLAFDIPFPK